MMAAPTASAPDFVLEGRDITVRFGGVVALSNVDMSVSRGAIVGLIGPNGAGKTTLVGVLSGLIRPAAGRVFWNGRDVTQRPAHQRARLGLARTFQQPELFAGLSVREHLVLARRTRARYHRQNPWHTRATGGRLQTGVGGEASRVDSLLESLHLEKWRDSPVAGLSLGVGRHLEIARALATDPEVVLLDEPLSGLDPGESRDLADVLEHVRATVGVSFLLIDHDVDAVLGASKHVTVLDFGRVIATGSADDVRKNELVKAAYLGDGVGAHRKELQHG